MVNQIAMFTAVIATVGAVFSYLGGATQANAGLYKNNAAIKKTEASNQWNYFQAKSTKQSLAEVSRDLSPADRQPTYQGKIDRYDKEKKEIEAEARKLETQATEWDPQRGANAPAPSLGAGHHGVAGVHRTGGHRAVDAQEMAGMGHVRRRRHRRRDRRAGGASHLSGAMSPAPRMKITTWNVNSLTARLQHVLDWTAANPVDVLCLQELKLTDDKFPLDVLRSAGYEHCAVFGQKTYNGVAIMSRHPLRDIARNISGFADEHSRVIAATLDGPTGDLRLVNGYFVNGQAPGTEKFEYKMSWLRGLRDYLRDETGPARAPAAGG